MKKASGIAKVCMILSLIAPSWAHATAGCGEIISITQVNKEPMDDIYRLNKQGVSTGGAFTQILSGIPGVGIFAAVIADTAIGAVASDAKQTSTQLKIEQEKKLQSFKDVFDVTIKPDFGNPITITIRENEVDRFGLEQGTRAVIYYPNTDPLLVTGNGEKISRTRPSFSKKIVASYTSAPEKPSSASVNADYIDVCYRGQKIEPYYIATGPWNPSAITIPPMTDFEIREVDRNNSKEIYFLNKKKSQLSEGSSVNPKDIDLLDYEVLNLRLLALESAIYAFKIDDKQGKVQELNIKLADTHEKLMEMAAKLGKQNTLDQSPQVARFRQSIVFRLKEKSDKDSVDSTK